jgi:hypothetical protein
MNITEIEQLRAEVRELKASLADVRHALESDSATDHIKTLYQYIADIHDYLMPVVNRTFPGFAADKERIEAFMQGRLRPLPVDNEHDLLVPVGSGGAVAGNGLRRKRQRLRWAQSRKESPDADSG